MIKFKEIKFVLVSILAIALFSCSSDGGDDSENVSSSSAVGQSSSSGNIEISSSSGSATNSCSNFLEGATREHYGKDKPQFCDERDGKKYVYVTIGSQTWMAENLNYETQSGSQCYDELTSNCDVYGRIYNWATAKTACPKGWHLPSDAEWTALTDFIGENEAGTKLKTASGWNSDGNGTDDYGFSALPGGYYGSTSGNFNGTGKGGYWWSTLEYNESNAYSRYMHSAYGNVFKNFSPKADLQNVRCVKN